MKKLPIILISIATVAVLGAALFVVANSDDSQKTNSANVEGIPEFLRKSFPNTDWSKTDPDINKALSGGPGKDGIPAIDNPKFEPIANFKHPDSVQGIVIQIKNEVKVYPYNILAWHEIVNDIIGDTTVAVTFCPLCGSAIVYDRTLPSGVTTFGVSGALIESNMVMYDRSSETLWQQSTGKALAGKKYGDELKHIKFQLLNIGDIKLKYPNAKVLSEDTGYQRDYARNPYSGYEDSDEFIFNPSFEDQRYPAKTIFVSFMINDIHVAVPWLELKNGQMYKTQVDNQTISLSKDDNELTITTIDGSETPFYFEMWFSWIVQHRDDGVVFDPSK